jgi:carbonic anhydrase
MMYGAVGALALGRSVRAEEPAPPATPDAALAELRTGNQRFARGEILQPRREIERLRALAGEQKPYAAVLGCADSRVPVEIVFDEGFGDLFVVRVAGNVATAVEIASLEYAVAVLGVKVIMVVGHQNCGAVKAALAGSTVPGQISTLYQHIVPGIDRASADLPAAIRANARYQARKLREGSTVIAAAVKGGTLAVAGGVFDLESGRVVAVDV